MYKVMIVDDKDIVRRELKRLKIWGEISDFTICEEAGNGQEALDRLAQNPVDLIITDIKMPKIDGIELLREVVERKLCSCIVLLSDYSEFSFARQGIILGAFDYIPKPVKESELSCLLQRAKLFLDHENMEKERVKKLEDLNSDKSDAYIQLNNIGKLAKLLQDRDQDTLKLTEEMLDQLPDSDKADRNKVEEIFKNSMKELTMEMISSCKWLDQFIDFTQLQEFHFKPEMDFDSIKKLFLDKIQTLYRLLNILKCNSFEKGIVGQVCNYILAHVEDDISLVTVADTLYLNKTYLSETFKQKTGMPFTEYVTGVKMERAKKLILQEDLKAYEIAERVGFKDTEYFSKVFKKSTGLTPTEFRKRYTSQM